MKHNMAVELFSRIGTGREEAVKRPADPAVDRCFRKMIEDANQTGDCIISGTTGYYRPRKSDPVESMEFASYIKADNRRAKSILYKGRRMKMAFKKGGVLCQTAEERERTANGSYLQSFENMALTVDEDSNIPGQMVMRML